MAKKEVATAKSLVGLVNDLNTNQLLMLTDSANRRALKKFLNGLRAPIKFVIADHFTVDTAHTAEVKISYLNDNFRGWFLDNIEEMSGFVLPSHRYDLEKGSLDEEILDDLGGADKAGVTLVGVFELLKLQPHGDEFGILLTNSLVNIFYVKDADDVLRAVGVYWLGDGWNVYAYRVGDEYRWGAGYRVFSRNS
jgi:hypothetical protein